MAKLYFRYGTVGSAKTMNLLAVAHTYRQQKKRVLLLKPSIDKRFGEEEIRSRAGMAMQADVLINSDTRLLDLDVRGLHCLLVDEVQFVEPRQIEELRAISLDADIPIICYGLRTDFRASFFPGSQRLMELADSIEEIKATCHYCQRKSTMNLKHVDGVAVFAGPAIELGAEELYYPVCAKCYFARKRG